MSTAIHAAPAKLSFGGLMSRLLLILVIWAALVYATLHYVGNVLPRDYQISQARDAAAEAAAKEAANPPAPAASTAAPAASGQADSKAATPAPAASSAAPATSAAPASSVAPASSAASAAPATAPAAGSAAKLPKDPLLAGYNRTALTNVARFYAIVITVLTFGVILLQIFKYKHVEEEPAH